MDDTDYMEHGTTNEEIAIRAFETALNLRVVDRNKKCFFKFGGKTFYGEIDGRIDKEDAIIEVKCPIRNVSPYLKQDVNGKWELICNPQNKCQYYHQIQAYMYALDKEWCYFVDWRSDRIDIVKIQRNKKFFNDVLQILKNYR